MDLVKPVFIASGHLWTTFLRWHLISCCMLSYEVNHSMPKQDWDRIITNTVSFSWKLKEVLGVDMLLLGIWQTAEWRPPPWSSPDLLWSKLREPGRIVLPSSERGPKVLIQEEPYRCPQEKKTLKCYKSVDMQGCADFLPVSHHTIHCPNMSCHESHLESPRWFVSFLKAPMWFKCILSNYLLWKYSYYKFKVTKI